MSANPTGPLTLGHGRQAVLGDCIARLLEATGGDVTREYYFNNGGRQMRVLGESVKARYLEQLGRAARRRPRTRSRTSTALAGVDRRPAASCFRATATRATTSARSPPSSRDAHGDALVDEPGDGRLPREAERTIFGEIRTTLAALGIALRRLLQRDVDLYEEGKLERDARRPRARRTCVYETDGARLAARDRARARRATACS